MNDKEKEFLKERIKKAMVISSQKLLLKKKALGQQLVVSVNGVIKTIDP